MVPQFILLASNVSLGRKWWEGWRCGRAGGKQNMGRVQNFMRVDGQAGGGHEALDWALGREEGSLQRSRSIPFFSSLSLFAHDGFG